MQGSPALATLVNHMLLVGGFANLGIPPTPTPKAIREKWVSSHTEKNIPTFLIRPRDDELASLFSHTLLHKLRILKARW